MYASIIYYTFFKLDCIVEIAVVVNPFEYVPDYFQERRRSDTVDGLSVLLVRIRENGMRRVI